MKNRAKVATNNLPTTAAGTKFLDFAERIVTAPMLSAILSAIFLKEPPDKKTWISIIITFLAIIYIFSDSLKLGNFYHSRLFIYKAFKYRYLGASFL